MNEFTIDFEVEFGGISERFVSEEAYKTQQKLKEDYMERDQKHMDIISQIRKRLKEREDYIKNLEGRINSQKEVINKIYGSTASANITNSSLACKVEELENENKVLKEILKDASGIEYTDSTDYISQLHKNVLNQRKELRNLNKALERERKRNKELEKLYSGAQRDVSMLNLKVMELNQGIRDSADLTWKEKYDELKEKYNTLEARYVEDSEALNGIINELRNRLKENNDQNNTTCKKLADDLTYITDRCSKAEHTIDMIKDALIDGDYILRRNYK